MAEYYTVIIDVQEVKTLLDHAMFSYLEGKMDKNDPFYPICEAQEAGRYYEFYYDGSHVIVEAENG